jgi:hypothetical protein
MNLEEIKTFCEENNFTSRSSRYEIMEKYFGVSSGTCKNIINFDRYLRWIFPADEVGVKKEAEYHKPKTLWGYEIESEKLYKDKIKFL